MTRQNLYLVSAVGLRSLPYDTYDGFVVAAGSPAAARNVADYAACGANGPGARWTAKLIGWTDNVAEGAVVLSSFSAG